MFGYPRRKITTRRVAPNVPLFDPSGDARCTGWWRADRNVAVDASSRVSGWTSMLPSGLTFAPSGPALALYAPDLTHGFPAILTPPGVTNYQTTGLARAGDTECTITYVVRVPYWEDSTAWILYWTGHDLSMGWRGYYGAHLGLGTAGKQNHWGYLPPGLTACAITFRLRPISDPTNMSRHIAVTYNAASAGAWEYGGPVTASPTSLLVFGDYAYGATFWHEIIYFHSFLADMEVQAMHTLLMRQYGIGV